MKQVLTAFFFATTLFFATGSPALAQGPQVWDGGCTHDGVATIQGVGCLIRNVLSVTITMLGLAAFVMLMFGSFRLLLSGGNSKAVEEARNTITFAVIGIVLALSSFIIINLISLFTGVTQINEFVIPESGKGQLINTVPGSEAKPGK